MDVSFFKECSLTPFKILVFRMKQGILIAHEGYFDSFKFCEAYARTNGNTVRQLASDYNCKIRKFSNVRHLLTVEK